MFVELHVIQNFAPSNLNRDDNGAPKDCIFGGSRRARISSQSFKRAIRQTFKSERLLPPDMVGERTLRAVGAITEQLTTFGHDLATATAVAKAALTGAGLVIKEENKTQYLLFLSKQEIAEVATLCHQQWDQLLPFTEARPEDPNAAALTGRALKKSNQAAFPKDLAEDLRRRLDGGRAADIALFGRMLADLASLNVDAATQVAHAISTHTVSVEFDYFTAVDDLQPREQAGAGMIGQVEFNSACFYRYANVDMDQLTTNLGGDTGLAYQSVEAFLRAAVEAIPTGKQNSMAAQNQPSLVMAVVRERGLWSLTNAFVQPAQATVERDLVTDSIVKFDAYWGALTRMYGIRGIQGVWVAQLSEARLNALTAQPAQQVTSVDEVIGRALAALRVGVGARV